MNDHSLLWLSRQGAGGRGFAGDAARRGRRCVLSSPTVRAFSRSRPLYVMSCVICIRVVLFQTENLPLFCLSLSLSLSLSLMSDEGAGGDWGVG